MKDVKDWTAEDFKMANAENKAALANVASQMEAELAESMKAHEGEETE